MIYWTAFLTAFNLVLALRCYFRTPRTNVHRYEGWQDCLQLLIMKGYLPREVGEAIIDHIPLSNRTVFFGGKHHSPGSEALR